MRKQTQTGAIDVPEYEPNRIGSYRPRILPHHLRRLWLLKQQTGKPMTELVAEALEAYFKQADRPDG